MKHTCHWPTCEKSVPPKMWGCKQHWFSLPTQIRAAIWKTYVPGQEITKTPSEDYLRVAFAADLHALNVIWETGTDADRSKIRDRFYAVCEQIAGPNFAWPGGLTPTRK